MTTEPFTPGPITDEQRAQMEALARLGMAMGLPPATNDRQFWQNVGDMQTTLTRANRLLENVKGDK